MLYHNEIKILQGKTAVITGGSRGIGQAIAIKLANAGADIAIIYSGNIEKANETISKIEEYSVKAQAFQCDVSNFMQVKSVIADIIKKFSSIDILVNNAGITIDKLILQMSEDDFDKVIDVNLKGVFNMIRHICPIMARNRSGKIINISSVSGITGNIGQANYAASKAGIIGLSKTVAKEYAVRNINCNVIAPGFIVTDMTDKLSDTVKEQVTNAVPLKRMGSTDDIANMAVFLASNYADYITGEVIKIDGGLCI